MRYVILTALMLAQAVPPAAEPQPPSTGRSCICTMEYDPVCARTRDGQEMTFSNACRARCVDAVILRRGQC